MESMESEIFSLLHFSAKSTSFAHSLISLFPILRRATHLLHSAFGSWIIIKSRECSAAPRQAGHSATHRVISTHDEVWTVSHTCRAAVVDHSDDCLQLLRKTGKLSIAVLTLDTSSTMLRRNGIEHTSITVHSRSRSSALWRDNGMRSTMKMFEVPQMTKITDPVRGHGPSRLSV